MDTEILLDSSRLLLESMNDYPEIIMPALTSREQDEFIDKLKVLSTQVTDIESEDDLLTLATAIYQLVLDIPSLRSLLIPDDIAIDMQPRTMTIMERYPISHPNIEQYKVDLTELIQNLYHQALHLT